MLVVRKSRIPRAGKGLFTTSRIRKGDVVVEYKGEKMTWAALEKRYGKKVDKAPYLFHVSDKNCVDAQRTVDELARYANDANGFSKKPGLKNNCEYDVIKGRPYIVAIREIPAGSEIFVDYAGDYWEVMNS
jgi:SET domain-containing protein